MIVRPATVLRWRRQGFRLFWRRKSRPAERAPRLPRETIVLIQRLARENPLWGAGRLRGELLKLDIRVSKRTVQRYQRQARPPRPSGQRWRTFLRDHAGAIRAGDVLPVTDLFFRLVYAFFVDALGTRRVVHVGVTRHPTGAWVAQQPREATPFEARPRFLIRDNDATYGPECDGGTVASGIRVLRTPIRAPRANAVCERFLGSVRRERLDHVLVLGERHLHRVRREYVASFNRERPHQGIGQATPEQSPTALRSCAGPVRSMLMLDGLHHVYRRAA